MDCSSCLPLNLLVSVTTQGGGVDDGDHQAGGGGALDGGWHHQATPQLPCAHHLLLARAAWKWAMIRLVTLGKATIGLASISLATITKEKSELDQKLIE